jgi:hypothetical protein
MKVDIALRGSVGEPLRNGEPAADRHEQIGDEIEANQAMAPFDAERQSGRDQRHEQRRVDAEKSRDVLEELVSGATGRRRLRDAEGGNRPVRQQPDDRRSAAIGCDAVHPYDSWAMPVRHPCRRSAPVARRTAARQWQAAA